MISILKRPWWQVAAAVALAAAAGAGVALERPSGADSFKSLRQQIDRRADAEAKACKRLVDKDNARAICLAQARGREAVARAELEERHAPGPEAELAVKTARAQADYGVARARCDTSRDAARKRCRDAAEAARDAAVRLAKVEKVKRQAELKAAEGKPKDTAEESPAARFASAKAYCAMQGLERDRCLEDAKRRFNKS